MFLNFYKINPPRSIFFLFLKFPFSFPFFDSFLLRLHSYPDLSFEKEWQIKSILEIAELAYLKLSVIHIVGCLASPEEMKEKKKRKKDRPWCQQSKSLYGDPDAKVVSVVTERVGSDKTGRALTKRISIILSRILFSSFDSFDFVGAGARKWSVRVSDAGAPRGCSKRPLRVAQREDPDSPRWYPVTRVCLDGFGKANDKGGHTVKRNTEKSFYFQSPSRLIPR